LPLCNAEAAGRNGGITREGAPEGGGNRRRGAIVEGIALRGEETEGALRVSQLPSRVIEVASRSLRREPANVLVRRLNE
jgi:hypothetical protein